MIISIIAAIGENNEMGIENQLPWKQSADLKIFKELTLGHHIVMGRRTYESIARTLPGRTTIVVTNNKEFKAPNCIIVNSLDQALQIVEEQGENEVFICGGQMIFKQGLALADRLYLTRIKANVAADVFFPEINEKDWDIKTSINHQSDDKNQFPYSFYLMEKKIEK